MPVKGKNLDNGLQKKNIYNNIYTFSYEVRLNIHILYAFSERKNLIF